MSAPTPPVDHNHRRRILIAYLRFVGILDLLALLAVGLPQAQMAAVHAQLGIGELPVAPIVGYLARTASMFYGLVGVMLLVAANDLDRYLETVRLLARCGLVAGLAILLIDVAEGLPWWWIALEGPCCSGLALIGLALLPPRRSE